MNGRNQVVTTAVVGVIIVALLIWVGVSRRQRAAVPTPTATETIAESFSAPPVKVGWLGPVTGDAASYGASIKRGVELAQRLTNANIELVFEDSKCEGKDAVSAVTKLINTDGVQAIIGEVCSGATLAAVPVATQRRIPMISAASTSPKLSESGEYFFRTVPSDARQGAFGAQLVYDKDFRRLAVLYSNEEYGLGFNNVLKEKFAALGGQVVSSEAFERTAVDLRTQLTKIKNAQPDAIYLISNSPDSASAALKQITELNIDAAIFGSEGLKSPDILAAAGEAAEGLILTTVSAGTAEFSQQHRAEFGSEPGPFAAQGYDAFSALARAAASGAVTGPAIMEQLRTIEFDGVSGHIKFDEHGDVAGNYTVFEVADGQFVPAK
ncbi:MAG: penicillin-binding protein activator [Candidatus Andersenbacteria bacterium]|nr:penicillin-binding protein activator [Candidatus Andersenbacteria bacterium]